MSPENNEMERAVTEIRGEQIPPDVVEAAGARVWARLSAEAQSAEAPSGETQPAEAQPRPVEHLRNCADFQSLLPDYKAGRLSPARALLMQDHLHACVACRRVYEGKVVGFPSSAPARPATPYSPLVRWGGALAATLAIAAFALTAANRWGLFSPNRPTTVQAVNGALYRVTAAGLQPVGAGQEIPDGAEIRTAKDSGAVVKLRDGSLLELRERSAFSATPAGKDLTVRLAQGSVIVQAAKRSSSHLYVVTPDCRVAVTGTVFGVTSGVKGSRVSVVQGEVRVSGQGAEKVLHPGDQTTTSPSLSAVRVQDDIAWSRNFEEHLALLKQLQGLQTDLQQVRLPDLRYSSNMLGRLPADTVLYASIPNLGNYFAEAQTVFRQRIGESPQLRAWLDQRTGGHFAEAIGRLQAASQYFGDEVVIVALAGDQGRLRGPVFLAEEKRPGFNEFVRAQGGMLRVETRAGLLAFSPEAGAAAALLQSLDGAFAGSPLYARVNEAYRNGAGLVFAADVSRLTPAKAAGNIQYIVGEQRQTPERSDVRAVVGFAGQRQGIAAWLAAPAPMGSLNYISPEATFVSAFVVKNPVAIVDEVVGLTRGSSDQARDELAKMQAATGVDVRNDLAASLGGEFALALDGPAFPVPSWKLVAEAYDANRLDWSLQKFVEAYNREAARNGKPALRTSRETVNGRTYAMIAGADGSPLTEAHYTIADGYLVAAPSRALVDKALQTRANGVGIGQSSAFLALLPRDRYASFSAMIYQNLGSTLAPLAGLLGSLTQMSPESQKALSGIGNMKATLITAYAAPDRIEVAGTGAQFQLPLGPLLTGNLAGIAGTVLPFGIGGAPRRGLRGN